MARDSPVSRNFVPGGHGLVSDTRACLAETLYRGLTLRQHLELATDIYTVELKGRSIFAF
jgi:hypothetical protein